MLQEAFPARTFLSRQHHFCDCCEEEYEATSGVSLPVGCTWTQRIGEQSQEEDGLSATG